MKTVKRKARVGENILITKIVSDHMRDMTIGKVYEVVELGYSPEYVEIIDDTGEQASAFFKGYEVIE